MKNILMRYRSAFLGMILILLVVVMDKYDVFNKTSSSLYIIFLCIFILFIVYFGVDKIIKIIKLKKVNNKDISILKEFTKYKLNDELVKNNNFIIDFHAYICKEINCFFKMNKYLGITKEIIKISNDDLKSVKNKDIKKYIDKVNEVYSIISKYYDSKGKRKI